MENSGGQPQLKGVVIITLPPADNPSLGKTITAFTLSDSPPPTITPSPSLQQPAPQTPQLPIQLLPNPNHQFSLDSTFFGSLRTILGLLGVSLLALVFFVCAFSPQPPQTLFELRDSRKHNDSQSSSFIFPLYPKLGSESLSQGDIELKLGRFVTPPDDDGASPRKIKKLVSTVSTMESTTILPVMGNTYPDGLYYAYMQFGSPPRPYFLDIDTGSDLTWIQCDAPCTSCAKGAHPYYKPKKGNILPSKDSLCVEVQKSEHCDTCNQCDYEVEYADHSSSMGVLALDQLYLMAGNGSLIQLNVAFGCAYDQQGLLLNTLAKTDGILGLSRAKVSLPSQLASQGIVKNVIGHCLATDAGNGGFLFLGDDLVPYQQMTWVPMLNVPSMNNYLVEVAKMSYGSKQLSLNDIGNGPQRVVFDSGSSYTYLTKQAYTDLVANLKAVSGDGLVQDALDTTLPICWQAKFPVRSVRDVRQFFKPLTLQFGRKWWSVPTKLQIPPEGYLITSNKGNVCLGILDGSSINDGSAILLGDISLRGQLIVYDNVNHKIGWVQSECVKPSQAKYT